MARPGLPDIDFTRVARQAVAKPLAELLSNPSGTVLDLSPMRQLDGESVTWAPEQRLEPRDERFDTVVSVLRSTREASVNDYARRLVRWLDGDDAVLLFVEPTRASGFTGRVQRLWRPATEISANLRVHEGFRLALWHAGMTVFRVDRYELARTAWPLTALAVGRARRSRPGTATRR